MGREIRQVPKNWKHPVDAEGHCIPLYDQSYEEALAEWEAERLEFEQDPEPGHTFIEWHGEAPDAEYYRPRWEEEPTHYQIYENVSEGTPTSPVFASLKQMEAWLLREGYSVKAASGFVKDGWAPSFVIANGVVSGMGIHSLDAYPSEQIAAKATQ